MLKEYFDIRGIKTLPDPHYSPGLALCDLWLTPVITERNMCIRLKANQSLKVLYFSAINTIQQHDYINVASSKWIVMLKKGVDASGECFEELSKYIFRSHYLDGLNELILTSEHSTKKNIVYTCSAF